ncbi:MAG TPA: PQQ-binding-like beta-propeller repeat protein [Vicinamibacterales bacterium]|nr:PQQ-binding-like beta-propeller repeat protein [Vicinamibacterales bacterium]
MKRTVLSLTLGLGAVITVSAENWPQWRGPRLNGVSAEKGLPTRWSPQENIAWKLPMPSRSGSTPIIWGNQIFLNVATAMTTGELELWAVDRAKGEILWKRPLGGGNNQQRKQNMSTPSPVTDGSTVWVMTGTGVLKAFDFKGAELWARDIEEEYGRFGLNWGYASSPLLHRGALYIQVLHGMKTDDPSYVFKVDGKSGKTLWKVERPTTAIQESPDAYTTPLLLQYNNTTEIVITGGDIVTGHDPETGKELWRSGGLNPDNDPFYRIVASGLIVGDTIIASTRNRPMLALRAGGRGDITATHRAWSFDLGPDVPTPVSDGKLLYVLRDNGVLHALDVKTGSIVYGPERLKAGAYSASPVIAEGRIYVTSENEGLTSVFTAGPKFQLIAENPLEDYCLSSPAVSGGQIFIRTDRHLWAIGERLEDRGQVLH